MIFTCLDFGLSYAQDLDLDTVIHQAVKNSYDLQIAQKDIQISQKDVAITRSGYFPKIQSSFNMEYLKDLEATVSPVVAVGNTVIPSGTRYQSSLGLSLNQTLIDFGTQNRRMAYSRKDVTAKIATYDQNLRDLKLKVVDLYTDALMNFRSIQAQQTILDLAREEYDMKKRMNDAGAIRKVDVTQEAIQMAQAVDSIMTLKRKLAESLESISYYTHEPYNVENTAMADIPDNQKPDNVQFDPMTSPEARNYDAQIDQKQNEIEILKRNYLPVVSFYSYYNMYGFDPNNYARSLKDLSERSISMGLSVTLPVFDGFKNHESIVKAELEKQKLALQKTKALADLQEQANQIQQQVETHTVLLETKAAIVTETGNKVTMDDRLATKRLVDKTQTLQDKVARIQSQLDSDKTAIQKASALYKFRVLALGQ